MQSGTGCCEDHVSKDSLSLLLLKKARKLLVPLFLQLLLQKKLPETFSWIHASHNFSRLQVLNCIQWLTIMLLRCVFCVGRRGPADRVATATCERKNAVGSVNRIHVTKYVKHSAWHSISSCACSWGFTHRSYNNPRGALQCPPPRM